MTSSPVATIERVLDALTEHGSAPRRSGVGWSARCPAHDDQRASLSISNGDGRVLVHCHAGCEFADVTIALGLQPEDLAPEPDRDTPDVWTPAGPAVATYEYIDERGRLLFGVCRTADKQFRQWRPDPTKKHGRAWSVRGVKLVPYRLPRVLEAIDRGERVYLVEGEKDVHALERAGATATCNAGGAGKWRKEHAKWLSDATVTIVADNDPPAHKHARAVAASLAELAASVTLARAAEGKDATDHLAAGHGLDDFLPLEDEPESEQPPAPQEDTADTVEPLALDQGAVILDSVERFVRRFVVFASTAQSAAVTLWLVHTWAFEAAETTPYIHVTAPEKRSGKTRLLEVCHLLARDALQAADMTAAALFRSIGDPAPAILFDEVQELFGRNASDDQRQLKAVLHAGHRLGGSVRRCVGDGGELRVEEFPVFCPKMLAGTGALPDMLADRSISVQLQRKLKSDAAGRFRIRRVRPEADRLRSRLAGWARTALPQLVDAEPDLPEALNDRAQDGWEPLLAIADLAGRDWPQRAHAAATELHGGDRAAVADESTGMLLLSHVRETFDARSVDRVATGELLAALVARDDGPWAGWWAKDVDKGETKGPAARLAHLLKPYGIKPKQVKIEGTNTRGYERDLFTDAWKRYLGEQHPGNDSQDATLLLRRSEHLFDLDDRVAETRQHGADQHGNQVASPKTLPGPESGPGVDGPESSTTEGLPVRADTSEIVGRVGAIRSVSTRNGTCA